MVFEVAMQGGGRVNELGKLCNWRDDSDRTHNKGAVFNESLKE